MTFSNHINSSEDDEFVREFPIPDGDLDWVNELVENSDDGKYCGECEFYDNNPILPCAVNPEYIHDAENCKDYSIGESDE